LKFINFLGRTAMRERLRNAAHHFGLLPKQRGQLARQSVACRSLRFGSPQSR
jgi:hypothetical protein